MSTVFKTEPSLHMTSSSPSVVFKEISLCLCLKVILKHLDVKCSLETTKGDCFSNVKKDFLKIHFLNFLSETYREFSEPSHLLLKSQKILIFSAWVEILSSLLPVPLTPDPSDFPCKQTKVGFVPLNFPRQSSL